MAAEQDEDGHAGGAGAMAGDAPARGNNKKLILILGPVLLLVGAAGAAYFTGLADKLFKPSHTEKPAPAAAAAAEPAKAPEPVMAFYDLPEMLINLNSASTKQNYLKIQIKLQLDNSLDRPMVDHQAAQVIDSFQVHMRELRISDLQGSLAIQRLHEELLRRAKIVLKPVAVSDVLFQEFLVQ